MQAPGTGNQCLPATVTADVIAYADTTLCYTPVQQQHAVAIFDKVQLHWLQSG